MNFKGLLWIVSMLINDKYLTMLRNLIIEL